MRWRQLFEAVDRDRKGAVSREELVRTLRAAKAENPDVLVAIQDGPRGPGASPSDDVLERAFESIEAGQDGAISLDEFCAQLEDAAAPMPVPVSAPQPVPVSAPQPVPVSAPQPQPPSLQPPFRPQPQPHAPPPPAQPASRVSTPPLTVAPTASTPPPAVTQPLAPTPTPTTPAPPPAPTSNRSPAPFRKLSRASASDTPRRLSTFEPIPVPPTVEELDEMAPDAGQVRDLAAEPAGDSMRELGKQVHSLLAALERANTDIQKLTDLNGTLRTQSAECLRVRETNVRSAQANEAELLDQLVAVSEDVALLESGDSTIMDTAEQVQRQLHDTERDVAAAHDALEALRANNAAANDELADVTSRAEGLRNMGSRAAAAQNQLRTYQKQARRAMLLAADPGYGTTAETTVQAVLRLSYDRPPLLLHRTWRALRRALDIRRGARVLEARRPVRECRAALRRLRHMAGLSGLLKRRSLRRGLQSWRALHRFQLWHGRKDADHVRLSLQHWAAWAGKRASFRRSIERSKGVATLAADLEARTSMVESMESAAALVKERMGRQMHEMVRGV